jgi:predicted nucleotidyltransferase
MSESDSDTEFISVSYHRKRFCEKTEQPMLFNPTFVELAEIVSSVLEVYQRSIIGAFIYGSRARGTNRPNSDADIIVFWRHEYEQEFLKSIRTIIEEKLGFKIDFVACVVKNKWIKHCDYRDEAYFENVIIDAKSIMGTESITHLIEHSIKLPKLSR